MRQCCICCSGIGACELVADWWCLGTYHYVNGEWYRGAWKGDMIQGFGSYFYRNGDWYEGEFMANVRCGRGTMHYGNGDMYVGAWQEGETNGFGVFSWAKGEKAGASHEGHFLPGGVRVGVGKFTKENKDMYECEWLEDLPEGFGKITYNSGARYAGELKAGRISGKGALPFTSHLTTSPPHHSPFTAALPYPPLTAHLSLTI